MDIEMGFYLWRWVSWYLLSSCQHDSGECALAQATKLSEFPLLIMYAAMDMEVF
jgi:hypothetical protein